MIAALIRSLQAISDPYFWKIIFFSALITLGIFGMFYGGIGYWLSTFEFEWGWVQWIFDNTVGWIGSATAIFITWLLFPLTFPLITILFLDSIASHMEKKYYRRPEEVKASGFWKALPGTIRFVLWSLFLNILVLPIYFLLPGISLVIYYLLNGYLLGREYLEMVAIRYHEWKEVRSIRKQYRFKLLTAGILIAVIYTTPFVNLLAPILATIFIVHVYHAFVPTQTSASTQNPVL